MTWHRGFPLESGHYLVELSDGQLLVTPWSDGTGYCEADGEYRRAGWHCLTHSRSTVTRWISINDLKAVLLS